MIKSFLNNVIFPVTVLCLVKTTLSAYVLQALSGRRCLAPVLILVT